MFTGAMAQMLRVGLVAVIEACQVVVKPFCLPFLRMKFCEANRLDLPNKLSIFFYLLDRWLHLKRIGTVVSRALELIRNQQCCCFGFAAG